MSARNSYLLKKFGITESQYDLLYEKQAGTCAVCGRHSSAFKNRLSVDHDHYTGEIRGLLCINCNRYIVGRHRKDRGADLLRMAYEYLLAEYTGWLAPPKTKKKKRKKHVRQHRHAK